MEYIIPELPLSQLIISDKIWRKTVSANKKLAELKGLAHTIPNQAIIINTLPLQESKDSSAVENIVTTHDELFKSNKEIDVLTGVTKEVHQYTKALFHGVEALKKRPLTSNLLIEISQILTERITGFRTVPGTTLKNEQGIIIYTPPQDPQAIQKQMNNLELFINTPTLSDLDPLIKMAIIHHQFESIHPFFDGNGRTGRILNILYLISENILDIPILYLSRYIIKHKKEYYDLLQKVRDEHSWEEWILYILTALEDTADHTAKTIEQIKTLIQEFKILIKTHEPKIYSHELINTLFSYPYTKIDFISNATEVSRQTASLHLQKLEQIGLLQSQKTGRTIYYSNTKLLNLLTSL